MNVQFILLGTGDPHYHQMFTKIAQAYPQKAAIFLTFNAPLAQKIYAGCDLFLMPSRFEPCGLGQMIAMRYGSVPVVRATGGLADTVHNFDARTGEGNGFTFTRYDRWALFAAVVRALETYRHQEVWRKLQINGMSTDFSWQKSAKRYVELYQKAVEFKRGAALGSS
jgi:starch synthase